MTAPEIGAEIVLMQLPGQLTLTLVEANEGELVESENETLKSESRKPETCLKRQLKQIKP